MRYFYFFLILLLPLGTLAGFNLGHWQFQKEIMLPQGAKGLMSVQLNDEVFSHANTSLSDLRVIDNNQGEVPYVVKRLNEITRVDTFTPRIFNLSSVPGKDTSFIVDLGPRQIVPVHNSITLLFAYGTKNFRRQVEIEGADSIDTKAWRVLNDKQNIYDYTLEFHAADTTVRYPDSAYRYLRVTISDGNLPPLAVNGVQAQRSFQRNAKTMTYQALSHQENLARSTEVVADLGKQGLFTNRASLTITGSNFERPVRVFGSNDAKAWHHLGGDSIYQYNTPEFVGSKSTIDYQETDDRYIKFIIENGDSPAITIQSATMEGVARIISFLGTPGHTYTLYYGSPLALVPQYDFESIYRYFDESTPIFGSLGVQKDNPSFAPPLSERSSWLFPLVLGIVVLSLAFAVFNLIRRTKHIPSDL